MCKLMKQTEDMSVVSAIDILNEGGHGSMYKIKIYFRDIGCSNNEL